MTKDLEEQATRIDPVPAKASVPWKSRLTQELKMLFLGILILAVFLPLLWLATLLFEALGIRSSGLGSIAALIALALAIVVGVLGGFNRFLDWLILLRHGGNRTEQRKRRGPR